MRREYLELAASDAFCARVAASSSRGGAEAGPVGLAELRAVAADLLEELGVEAAEILRAHEEPDETAGVDASLKLCALAKVAPGFLQRRCCCVAAKKSACLALGARHAAAGSLRVSANCLQVLASEVLRTERASCTAAPLSAEDAVSPDEREDEASFLQTLFEQSMGFVVGSAGGGRGSLPPSEVSSPRLRTPRPHNSLDAVACGSFFSCAVPSLRESLRPLWRCSRESRVGRVRLRSLVARLFRATPPVLRETRCRRQLLCLRRRRTHSDWHQRLRPHRSHRLPHRRLSAEHGGRLLLVEGRGSALLRFCKETLARECVRCARQAVTHVNTSMTPEYMAYMLKYDSVHGRFPGKVEVRDGSLFVNDRRVHLSNSRDPSQIDWQASGTDFVCESTGAFCSLKDASQHVDR